MTSAQSITALSFNSSFIGVECLMRQSYAT
jgi:hypothetical protein